VSDRVGDGGKVWVGGIGVGEVVLIGVNIGVEVGSIFNPAQEDETIKIRRVKTVTNSNIFRI
jgi:hypothetical protein